jgi:hypothetical protein
MSIITDKNMSIITDTTVDFNRPDIVLIDRIKEHLSQI